MLQGVAQLLGVAGDDLEAVRSAAQKTVEAQDRRRLQTAAVRALEKGKTEIMVALDPPTVRYVHLDEATKRLKSVPLDSDTVLTARDLGISFGD